MNHYRHAFMDTYIDVLSMEETIEEIDRRIVNGEFTIKGDLNAATYINMQTDPVLRESVESSSIINIDGMGVLFAAKLLGIPNCKRVAGVDLFQRLLAHSAKKKYPVYLLGAAPDVIQATVNNIEVACPGIQIAGYQHGYFWDKEIETVNAIKNSGAKLLFVGIKSPEKEVFIKKWQEQLGVTIAMGVGGSFDVVAGKVKRAPVWMQKTGLEWLYRVIQEPRRMWKRYAVTNSLYLYKVIPAILGYQIGRLLGRSH